MQRQHGELVPVVEALADLPVPVQVGRKTPPPARRGFTHADQVHQLVNASEADADLGFMARMMALCSLLRTNPGNQLQYVRTNGPYKLGMIAGLDNKLPYGNFPRLLLAWVSTEAVRTQSRVLVLGDSLSDFMRALGVYSAGGRNAGIKLRNQMRRLFNAHVQLIYEDEHGEASVSSSVTDSTELWWNVRKPGERSLWESKIELSEKFSQENHPPPGAARHEYPQVPQALYVGSRSLPMDGLPHLRSPRSAAPLLAAGVPSVWSAPRQIQRQQHRSSLPVQGSPRTEEDQAGLAGSELHHG